MHSKQLVPKILASTTSVLVMICMSELSAQRAVPTEGQTSAQVYKSVQILKDMPSTEMIPAMRVIAASLGVECEFCHVTDRAGETEKKQIARRMMTMVMALNQNSFAAQRRVTCYTCHRGSNAPLAAPVPTGKYTTEGVGLLIKGTGNPIPGGTDAALERRLKEFTAEQAASLPSPETIFAKYVAALGGEAAIRRVTSRKVTALQEAAADVRGLAPPVHALVQLYSKAPNQWVMTLQAANARTSRGFDGSVAWIQDARGGVTESTGATPAPPQARAKRNADFYEPLNLRQSYAQVSTRAVVKVNDRDAYLVVGTPTGDLPEQLYFDKETGLLVRKGTATPTTFGDYAIQTDFEDYRDVGGVKYPYVVRTIGVSPADSTTTYVERVENNPTLDNVTFVKPALK
jgi:photosynthetic reaction center cytochrome c subunit